MKNRFLRTEILLLLVLTGLSAATSAGSIGERVALANDNHSFYNYYVNTWRSLNHFGELAWWDPSFELGNPAYFPAMAGHSLLQPVYALFCALFYALGRIGIRVDDYFAAYVSYFTFALPLFSFGCVLFFLRQTLANLRRILFVLVILPFSPGFVIHLSDLAGAPEQLGISCFLAGAGLKLVRRKDTESFALFSLSVCITAFSASFSILHWTAAFIPIFALSNFVSDPRRWRTELVSTGRGFPAHYWIGLALAAVISCSPALIALFQSRALVGTKMGGLSYSMQHLRIGNPFEILWSALPGVGVTWTSLQDGVWRLFPAHDEGQAGYIYCGFATLPLAAIGCIAGRSRERIPLMLILGVMPLVVMLSIFSPLILMLVRIFPVLGIENHHSDLIFRNGLFLILLMVASFGFELIVRKVDTLRMFRALLILTGAAALTAVAFLFGRHFFWSPIAGFSVMIWIATVLAITARLHGGDERLIRIFPILLLCIILLDAATVAHWHIRRNLIPNSFSAAARMSPLRVGYGLPFNQKPFQARELFLPGGPDPDDLPEFLIGEPDRPIQVEVSARTYNTLTLSVEAAHESLLIWTDHVFPGWSAEINGVETPIVEHNSMKGVRIPQGVSRVNYRFSPPLVPWLLSAAAAVMAMLGGWWLYCVRRMSGAAEQKC